MKSKMKFLVWIMVLSLILPLMPLRAHAEHEIIVDGDIPALLMSAAEQAPEITDYAAFLESLKILEDYARAYTQENPGKDPLDLMIKYIRTGVSEYTAGVWNSLAGSEDLDFALHVLNCESEHNAQAQTEEEKINVVGLKNLTDLAVPNGDVVDMSRVFAVMDAYNHNNGSNLHADVAGWAGDLVDLLVYADSKAVSGTLDEMIATISGEYFLKNAFTKAEYFADMDGYAIIRSLTAGGYEAGKLYSAISGYYTAGFEQSKRAEYFVKNRLGGVTDRSDIREAVFAGYTGNETIAALENSKSMYTQDVSDLRRACCYAFADYLCKLAGDFVEQNENIYYTVVSNEKTTLASGITQETLKAQTSDGKQIVYYLATADLSNPYVNVHINYKDNDPSKGWGMQSVRDQAHAAEDRHSDPSTDLYIPNYNVVVAVNGAGYNMTTGKPNGLLVMEGVEHMAPDGADHGAYGFFGILKDGTAVIGSTAKYYELKEQGLVMEGIDCFGTTLVQNGKLAVSYSSSHTTNRASRTAVGITKTGKVVMMVLDGRQEPVSCGGSFQEIAQIMLDAGCVDAINLDGGGSTTFLAELPGDDDISLINNPSDGFERSVSTSMIIVSTMPGATSFDHAKLDAEAAYLTVGSEVQLTAAGFNAAGAEVAIPAGTTWSVSDDSVATVSASGLLTAQKKGQVEVKLSLAGKVVGSKTMYVVTPDAVYFEKDSMSAVHGETITLPVAAKYEGKKVAIREQDVVLSLSNASAGAVNGFNFTANTDGSMKRVVVTAALAEDPTVTGSMSIALYSEGVAAFDFDNATGGNRRLAWLRQISNATTEDYLTYTIVDTSKVMTNGYTLAFDLKDIPVNAQIRAQVCTKLEVEYGSAKEFLLALADKISPESTATVEITFDSDLTVDPNGIELTSQLFELESAKVDGNTLTVVLRWKQQSAPLNSETVDTVCMITGIAAVPAENAAWDSNKRLALENELAMDLEISFISDALHTYAQANPTKGIAAFESGAVKGGTVSVSIEGGTDGYSLINDLKSGWQYEEGGYAYYVDGTRLTGVRKAGEFFYDFGENGINVGQTRYTGIFQIDGVNYYAKDGVLTPGWYINGDDYYYFDQNGAGYDGKVEVDEVELEFDNGLQTGGYTGFVKKTNGYTYHYTDGKMDYGWLYVGQDLYHFSTNNGVMTTGTHVIPDEEASAKGAYYDFASDGRTLRGYFNGFGYYYWAGLPRKNDWVKSGADKDPDAWYRTNSHGHFVTDTTGKETFSLTLDGKTYKAVKIECDGVVYTFDNSNGKLLQGSLVLKNGNWYYYWAGAPVNDGWFELNGNTYYAYADGHLALGSNTIDGVTYMFTSQGVLVTEGIILTAELTKDCNEMKIRLTGLEKEPEGVRIAVWAREAGQQATLKWFDMERIAEGEWELEVQMCQFRMKAADTFELHAYTDGESPEFIIGTTVYVSKVTQKHTFTDMVDGTCDYCGVHRETVETRKVHHMLRMYNPNTGEHFYTGSEEERDMLVAAGWNYEGVAFTFPANTGAPVYRLFEPATGEHLYTMDEAEKAKLEAEGWNYEGIAFNSAYDTEAVQHRLYNPNTTVGAYHFTFSEEEKQNLINAGWWYQGIGWYSCWK